MTKFWVKSTIILSVLAPTIFVATKNGRTKNNFPPLLLLLLLDPGSGIDKNQDPGSVCVSADGNMDWDGIFLCMCDSGAGFLRVFTTVHTNLPPRKETVLRDRFRKR
jgi:hypothetical protein